MRLNLSVSVAILATLFTKGLLAQGPDGSEINKAIPIYFGQTVTDIGDGSTRPFVVYAITLARGQSVTILASKLAGTTGDWGLFLLRPGTISAKNAAADVLVCMGINCSAGSNSATVQTLTYQVSVAGTYYVMPQFRSTGMNYSLVVSATGTPIAVPNPTSAGCLSGRVDSLTYSLQFIAVGLADEVTIGGSRACSSCTVKAPLYPEIVTRLENALRSKVNVEACYDSGGNIFQIKLVQ